MAYVMVEDDTASMELLCFSRVLETCGAYMKENQAVVVKGRLSVRDEKAPRSCATPFTLCLRWRAAFRNPSPSGNGSGGDPCS